MKTKNLKKFDSDTIYAFYTELDQKLKEIGAMFGIKIKRGTVKWSDAQATTFITANTVNSDGETKTPEGENWRNHCHLYGFKKEDMGREFIFNHKSFRICGLMPNRPKYPVIAASKTGRRFKFPVQAVKNGLVDVKEDTNEDEE